MIHKMDTLSYINNISGGMFQHANRYFVTFPPPKGAPASVTRKVLQTNSISNFTSRGLSNLSGGWLPSVIDVYSLTKAIGQASLDNDTIGMYCSEISFPHKDIQTTEQPSNGIPYNMATGATYGALTATFICGEGYREYDFFKGWLDIVHNTKSHTFNFFDEYKSTVTISSLSKTGKVTKEFKAIQAYPTTISDLQFSAGSSDFVYFSVSFQLRYTE